MKTTLMAATALAVAAATLGAGPAPDPAGAAPDQTPARRSVQCTTAPGADFTWEVCVEATPTRVRGTATYRPANGGTGRVVSQRVSVESCGFDRTGCTTVAGPTTGATATVTTPRAATAPGRAFRACGGSLQDTAGVRLLDVCSPAVPIDAGRELPAVVVSSDRYDVELIPATAANAPDDTAGVFFRRIDLVGNTWPGPYPDPYGALTLSGWGDLGGATCLMTTGGTYTFAGDPTPHAFTYGLAGARVRQVRVVGVDGSRTTVATKAASGTRDLRPWLMERPVVGTERIEALDGRGRVVATVPGAGMVVDDFGSSSTCR
jgi:hypothetical protein